MKRGNHARWLSGVLLLASLCMHALAVAPQTTDYEVATIDISSLLNNQGASADGGKTGDFDGTKASYDASLLPTGSWTRDGIKYALPESWGERPDNVLASGQILNLNETIHEIYILYAATNKQNGDSPAINSQFNVTFADRSTTSFAVPALTWTRWPTLQTGAIGTPYRFVNGGASKNFNVTNIYAFSTSLPSHKSIASITFPAAVVGDAQQLHVFAMSLVRALPQSDAPVLAVRDARFTTRWEDVEGERAQAVRVTLANLLAASVSNGTDTALVGNYSLEVTGPGVRTFQPGRVQRLMPGNQVRVDVLVHTDADASGNATVTLRDPSGEKVGEWGGWEVSPIPETWTVDRKVLARHEAPRWWKDAKFGIFIHWGVYSVPAWGPANNYAEWYDFSYRSQPQNSSNPTWQHHLQTYGPGVQYDDFIANFTATKFNASEWVDLFDRFGAKYFVLVTKHHDGYALFDTGNTSHRNSVVSGPKRDLLAELLDAAKTEKPHLRRGTYFSLPEWFHPDYSKYGFNVWPGGLPHNPYNGSIEGYAGYVPIDDYVEDLIYPQMVTLAEKYETEIMWCDIGGPNKTAEFLARWYNYASAQGRQVTLNNRCGALPDFETPEYTRLNAIQTRDWETNEGVAPFSYGINLNPAVQNYKTGTDIVQTLVDIVSKNGNFLLDIGPDGDGAIPEAQTVGLVQAGAWLERAGECIYGTDYWFSGPQPWLALNTAASQIRYLTTPTTFCVISLQKPGNTLVLPDAATLPLLLGDELRYLGWDGPVVLNWTVENGQLGVDLEGVDLQMGSVDAWAFQFHYVD